MKGYRKDIKKDRRSRKKELSSEAEMSKTIQHGEKIYMIINAWQHIEDQGKKLMGFEMNERVRHRTIKKFTSEMEQKKQKLHDNR